MTEPGIGVDSRGGPVIDPTKNVLDLVTAAVKRLDDLRALDHDHIRQLAQMRADHDRELREAEAKRIDAIRAVDVAAVQRSAEVSADQAAALAAQVAASAEAMRAQVAAAATAAQIALTEALRPMQVDIADLRKAQYEAAGNKQQSGDSRLTLSAVIAGLSVLVVLFFGAATLIVNLN